MSRPSDVFISDLYELGEERFEQTHGMTKRAACVRFQIEAYTIGYQDARAGLVENNGYESVESRDYYAQGYRLAKKHLLCRDRASRHEGAPMIDASEVARVHAEATRCRYKTGTLGVWARHWLELYEVSILTMFPAGCACGHPDLFGYHSRTVCNPSFRRKAV